MTVAVVEHFLSTGPPGVLLLGGACFSTAMCLPDPVKHGRLTPRQLVGYWIFAGVVAPAVFVGVLGYFHVWGI
jgi:hypothetical protein